MVRRFFCVSLCVIGISVLAMFFWTAGSADSVAKAEPPAGRSDYVPEGYKLIWSDEFDGATLNGSKWASRGLGQRRGGVISDDCSFVDGKGHLIIETRREGNELQSGMIATHKSFLHKFGYFEARMKFPVYGAQNSGFWLQSPANAAGGGDPVSAGVEVDIIEFYRGRHGGSANNALHWGGYGENHHNEHHRYVFDDAATWHTYGLLWTSSEYKFFTDGKETWSTTKAVSNVPQYMILSTVIGQRSKALENAPLPDRFQVDYVRVYAPNDAAQEQSSNP
jgi:beta-glucanase (GH16 family)